MELSRGKGSERRDDCNDEIREMLLVDGIEKGDCRRNLPRTGVREAFDVMRL